MKFRTNVDPMDVATYADRCQSRNSAARDLDRARKACFPKVSGARNTHSPMKRQPVRRADSQSNHAQKVAVLH